MSLVDKLNSDRVWGTMLDLDQGQGGAGLVRGADGDFRGNGFGTGHEIRHVVAWLAVRHGDGHAPVGAYRWLAKHPKVARRFRSGLGEALNDGGFAGMGGKRLRRQHHGAGPGADMVD